MLNTILLHEPLSRADLVRLTHMSKPTVSSLTDELIVRGIISEIGIGASRGGRRPILLRFNSERQNLLAFEMGRFSYQAAVANLKGAILQKTTGTFQERASFTRRLALLKEEILLLLKRAFVPCSSLLKSIYIAPGIYVGKGKALKWASDSQSNGNEELEECFHKISLRPLLTQHSTKLSLLGEKVAGKARGLRNVIYVDFAYGLGCAIMVDGKQYHGTEDSAGEIGYFYSTPEEHRNASIRPYELGCLESHISGKALQVRGTEALLTGGGGQLALIASREAGVVSGKTIFDAYRLGDPQAKAIVTEAFSYFNMALCNAINLLAPEAIILGGGFSAAGEILEELVQAGVRERVLVPPHIAVSELGREASLIGGIHHLIEHTDFLTELSQDE